jgi:hypothetical protein
LKGVLAVSERIDGVTLAVVEQTLQDRSRLAEQFGERAESRLAMIPMKMAILRSGRSRSRDGPGSP